VKNILIALAILLSVNSHALDMDEIKMTLKNITVKVIGKDFAAKFFGDESPSMDLPAILKIVADATSTEIYKKKKEKVTLNLTEEQKSEYNVSYINELIMATREVKANRDELGKWYNTLSQGATREGVYRAMVLDDYYRRLENYNDSPSRAVVDFAIPFMDRYVNQKVSEKTLAALNLYSIKRLITEKALDIADTYLVEDKDEDFYRWYSVLSSDLAKNYPIWSNKLRAQVNPQAHLAWAKKVPNQYVKSEIIIKMHTLFNNLQKRSTN